MKFAIRPTIRSHSSLTRDLIIRSIADVVGPAHKVDLGKPDVTILVEVYRVRPDSLVIPRPRLVHVAKTPGLEEGG